MNGKINNLTKGAKKILRSHPSLKYSLKAESSLDNIPGKHIRDMRIMKSGVIDLIKVFCVVLAFMSAVMLICCIKRKIKKMFIK